jgi:hypothetical protein
MLEVSVPPPSILFGVHRQTHRSSNLQIQLVQPSRTALNPSKEPLIFISERHYTTLDLHFIARFVELTHTNDAHSQQGNVVQAGENTMFPSLALVENGAYTLDIHH